MVAIIHRGAVVAEIPAPPLQQMTMFQIDETVSKPSYHRSKGSTRRLIIDAVYDAPNPLTRLDIARSIGRKKTPHLVGVIEELVSEGVIVRTHTYTPGGVVCYLYGGLE